MRQIRFGKFIPTEIINYCHRMSDFNNNNKILQIRFRVAPDPAGGA